MRWMWTGTPFSSDLHDLYLEGSSSTDAELEAVICMSSVLENFSTECERGYIPIQRYVGGSSERHAAARTPLPGNRLGTAAAHALDQVPEEPSGADADEKETSKYVPVDGDVRYLDTGESFAAPVPICFAFGMRAVLFRYEQLRHAFYR
eukprot:6212672-Pleurochrysis_carterae.AAC.4